MGMDPRLVSLHNNHEIWLYLVRSFYSPTSEQTANASWMPLGVGGAIGLQSLCECGRLAGLLDIHSGP